MFNKRMEIVTFSSLKHLTCGFSSIQFFPLLLTSSTALETLPLCTSFLPSLGGVKILWDSAALLGPQQPGELRLWPERSCHSPGEAGALLGRGSGAFWRGWKCKWAAGVSGWQQ